MQLWRCACAAGLPADLLAAELAGLSLEYLHELLAPCAALRELYILNFTQYDGTFLDLPSIAAICPVLQVLVLYVDTEVEGPGVSPCTTACTTMQTSCSSVLDRSSCASPSAWRQDHHACAQANPFGKGEVVLPRLEVLIIVNAGMEPDDLVLRCGAPSLARICRN